MPYNQHQPNKQVHGMPRILGVLTQLDRLRTQKQVRRRKKELKTRFRSEIAARANLFNFSGISRDYYPQREVINLARFLSVLKPKVIRWRNSHPYLLADRSAASALTRNTYTHT